MTGKITMRRASRGTASKSRGLKPVPAMAAAIMAAAFIAGPAWAQDAQHGLQIFQRCSMCHTIGDKQPNIVGPNLHGVVGRAVASQPGFHYSPAMTAAKGVWTAARLDHFLAAPAANVPGTRMGFGGIPNPADRRDLIAFLTAQGTKAH